MNCYPGSLLPTPLRPLALAALTGVACLACTAPGRVPIAAARTQTSPPVSDPTPPSEPRFEGFARSAASEGGLTAYVALGLAESPRLAALRARVEAAGERGAQASALPNPTFSWTEFLEEVETRTGPNERRYRLDQPLPWPGVRAARGDLADAEAAALASTLAVEEAALVERIEGAWLDLAYAHERVASLAEELELLESLGSVVQARVESGGPREDWLKLEIAVARAEDALAGARAGLGPLSARLSALCGIDFDGRPLAADLDDAPIQAVDAAAFEQAARAASPRLERLASDIASAEAARAVAERADRPSLAVGVEYVDIGDALDPSTPGAGDDPFALRFSIGLPVWRSSYAAARREAERSERAARLELDAGRFELEAELTAARFELDDAERKQRLCEEVLLPRAREAYELTRASYAVGEASLTELIDAERALLDLDLETARAVLDRGRALARLRALAGAMP
ncbi:MAG: TolC family protein [Planctomycetota bacterium]